MEETKIESTQTMKKSKPKTALPFIVTLIGIIIMIASLFLPHITAVGDLAEYIKENPEVVENEDLGLITRDLANVPLVSIDKIYASALAQLN